MTARAKTNLLFEVMVLAVSREPLETDHNKEDLMVNPDHITQQTAYLLDSTGGGQPLAWEAIAQQRTATQTLWLTLNYTVEETQRWLTEESGIDPIVCESLLAEDTRPRCFVHGQGLLAILRGVNLNPGENPEDMVSVRVWIEPSRVITVSHRRLMALGDIAQSLESGDGPHDSGDFLVQLTQRLARRMASVLEDFDDAVAELEDEVLVQENLQLRTTISVLRRQAIRLRRYLAPQREVMARLQTEKVAWFSDLQRAQFREVADQVTRYVEDLDSAKDRAAIVQDELEARIGAQMNKTMYLLSIVAAIFLPLGLLTGLLGINVGGIPGTESPYAFIVVCVALVLIAIVQGLLFRRMRWM